ncbi:MAG: YihY/virulence factor BrkB family protein [Victivallaceae bacterium]|nr:YihY/virulence factor BrkB family protein [Victivallaceae bacterium]
MKRLWFGIGNYFAYGLWHCDLRDAPFWKRHAVAWLRIAVLLLRNLKSTRCQLWASALTYYSMFAMVPIMALGIAIAGGFGLESNLRRYVTQQLANNPGVADYLLGFADRMLENTRMGLVAGVGVVLLLFAVIKMIGNIENAFNFVYGVHRSRPLLQKVGYYLSLLLICPVVVVVAGSATALVTSVVNNLARRFELLPLAAFGLKMIPFVLVWLLLALLYKFLPYTKVRFKPALAGAVVAGTLYQFLQMGFISLQYSLSKYNAVYGSFSAVPLFMIYLQFSWLIVLFGIQITFVCQNIDNIDAEPGGTVYSGRYQRKVLLLLAGCVLRRQLEHLEPPTAEFLAAEFNLPSRIVNRMLGMLVDAKVVIGAGLAGGDTGYVPLLPAGEMTVLNVLARCDAVSRGNPPPPEGELAEKVESLLGELTSKLEKSGYDVRLDTLV